MKRLITMLVVLSAATILNAQEYKLNEKGYFNYEGVDAMAFDDFYPEGHQGGISFIMNGKRVATNGDIRFDETPVTWTMQGCLQRETTSLTERTTSCSRSSTELCLS